MPKIVARFERMADAAGAVKMLKRIGVSNACLDAMDDYGTEFAAEMNIPGNENGPSLSGLVLNSGGYASKISKAPLLASDPMVSGMESHEDTARNHSTRLIANASEEQLESARKLIMEMGGDLNR